MKADETSMNMKQLKPLQPGTDTEFQRQLVEMKHDPQVEAPVIFRELVHALAPFRGALWVSVKYQHPAVHVGWTLRNFGSKGTPEQVGKRIKGVRLSEDPAIHIDISPFTPFEGGKGPACGGTLTVTQKVPYAAAPTLGESLTLLPFLAHFPLPEPVLKWGTSLTPTEIAFGGNWERLYGWTLSFPVSNETEALSLGAPLKDLPGVTVEPQARALVVRTGPR